MSFMGVSYALPFAANQVSVSSSNSGVVCQLEKSHGQIEVIKMGVFLLEDQGCG